MTRQRDTESNDLDSIISEISKELDNSTERLESARESLDRLDHTQFPTEMKCSQAFDELIDCYSIGGQLRHVYRYGNMDMCQDKRAKLKFCLFTKLASKDEQRKRISEYYMQRIARQKLENGSSEDIWIARSQLVDRPFRED